MIFEFTSHSLKTGKRTTQFVDVGPGAQIELYDNAKHPFGFVKVVSKDHVLLHIKTDEPRVEEPQLPKVSPGPVPIELLRGDRDARSTTP